MARKEDLVIRALVDAAAEIGVESGRQAFAAKMAPAELKLMQEGKLNEFQIALKLGWDGPFVYGNRIDRKVFARIIFERLRNMLSADANPGSDLARHLRDAQMRLL